MNENEYIDTYNKALNGYIKKYNVISSSSIKILRSDITYIIRWLRATFYTQKQPLLLSQISDLFLNYEIGRNIHQNIRIRRLKVLEIIYTSLFPKENSILRKNTKKINEEYKNVVESKIDHCNNNSSYIKNTIIGTLFVIILFFPAYYIYRTINTQSARTSNTPHENGYDYTFKITGTFGNNFHIESDQDTAEVFLYTTSHIFIGRYICPINIIVPQFVLFIGGACGIDMHTIQSIHKTVYITAKISDRVMLDTYALHLAQSITPSIQTDNEPSPVAIFKDSSVIGLSADGELRYMKPQDRFIGIYRDGIYQTTGEVLVYSQDVATDIEVGKQVWVSATYPGMVTTHIDTDTSAKKTIGIITEIVDTHSTATNTQQVFTQMRILLLPQETSTL